MNILWSLLLCTLASFVSVQDPVEPGPNILLICVDDLRPELGCYGVDYIESPNIDALAADGRMFRRHFVQAPTCGASRFTLLSGTYGPSGNGALMQQARALQGKTLPGWFRQHGYSTVSVGKVSHYPGGRGGKDWNDPTQQEMPEAWDRHLMPTGAWKHPRGAMHGLANGEIRGKAGEQDLFQSFDGRDEAYPDGLILNEALVQMTSLAQADKPFFLAVGLIRPHLPFGAPARFMKAYEDAELPPTQHPSKPKGKTTWHGSGEFMQYNRWKRHPNKDAAFALEVRKHYAACVSYADSLVGQLLERLDDLGLRENTVIVLWGDHGWHLGEHAIWGKHSLFEESLRSPLIISYGGLALPGESTGALAETLDIFPTLCELAGLKVPAGLDGTSLVPILEDPKVMGHAAFSYASGAKTIRTDTHRLIVHRDGSLELYNHRSALGETKNLAELEPELAQGLLEQLRARMP